MVALRRAVFCTSVFDKAFRAYADILPSHVVLQQWLLSLDHLLEFSF